MKKLHNNNVSVLLLAAGASRRLGQAKQLLGYQGKPLIVNAAEKALSLKLPVAVVLGASYQTINATLGSYDVNICINDQWQEGIGSSIRTGMATLEDECEAVLIMLCDQPLIPGIHYQHLLDCYEKNPDQLCVTKYPDSRLGVPAIIPQQLFAELKTLQGDQGAQSIIKNSRHRLIQIACDEAASDIDTPAQAKLLQTEVDES